jgi:nicotinamide mononucleotide adenylyltransferase
VSLRVRVLVEVGPTDGDVHMIQHDHAETIIVPRLYVEDDPQGIADMMDLAGVQVERMVSDSVAPTQEQMRNVKQIFGARR